MEQRCRIVREAWCREVFILALGTGPRYLDAYVRAGFGVGIDISIIIDICVNVGVSFFVAVDYSSRNAELNGIANARAQLSNGFDQIDRRLNFNLIASNIPAKVGKEMLSLYLYDARDRLRPGGRLYLVSVNGLRQFLKRNLIEVFGNYEKLKQGAHYTVALAHKTGG